ncbi:MAG: DUF4956 domain-containing protein [Anaerolineaceae bacterium]|nr:DUF4956 domain-containing protein [Anaerolineaceae bacterium]
MNTIQNVFNRIASTYSNDAVSTGVILAVLLMVLVLSAYEFIVYRLVSHRAFYNKAFNISIAVLPFFISTIILCLQSNLVITLGTIGALAIIRYRTAVKDPVDMLYILWSIHTGIVCGCQLYEVAVLTSLVVTIVLLILEHLNFGRKPFILILNTKGDAESEISQILKGHTKSFKIKSRNYNEENINYAIELSVKDPHALSEELRKSKAVERFSVIRYDAEDTL